MKQILTMLLIAITLTSVAQTYSKCSVFQYEGTDSTHQKVVSEESYNSNGQLISRYYDGYKESASVSNGDAACFYFYQDSLLVLSVSADGKKDSSKMFSYFLQDSSKTIYYYNASGQKIKEEHFEYKKRLKKDVDKGWGRPGGCIITEEDYEKDKTWEKISEIHFKYDRNGNKILYDATKLHFNSQNKYTWKYDAQNRITEYSSYDKERLIWTERYTYSQDAYNFTRTWYDYEGNPKHLKEEDDSGYWPQYTFSYKLNDKGQVTEEKTTNEKGELVSAETFDYNPSGVLIRSCTFDSKEQVEITHIYIYN